MQQFKLKMKDQESIKGLFSTLLTTYEHGGCFFFTDREKVTYKQPTPDFDLPDVPVGMANKAGGVADTVIKRQSVIEINVEAGMYGKPVRVLAGPLWSDDFSSLDGIWALALPRVDRITAAFDDFAPVLAEMFPEGAMFYATNTTQVTKKQGSTKFDTHKMQVGDSVNGLPIVSQAMRGQHQITQEVPEEVYGVPALVICQPILDDTDQTVVGAFGVGLPRTLPRKLKEMAGNLGQGLTEVSSAMEELAASSAEIAHHQNVLHEEIGTVSRLADEITEVLNFIKQIADETKMLGLNAAIEAARAGDQGRGFGVVAEEIRKLSDESKETVNRIRNLIAEIGGSLGKTRSSSQSTLQHTNEVAAANQETTASIEQMAHMARELNQVANQL